VTPAVACLTLAALDSAGTYAAVHAARGSRAGWVLGLAAFTALFVVLVRAIDTASLTGVMLGWIVLVQLAAIAIDVRVLDAHLNPGVWVGVGVALAGLTLALLAAPTPTLESR
jgi:Mg/Co/Ni transporter MgtE